MTPVDDGGAAFPSAPNTQPGRYPRDGMSLRDWFAGKALAGLMSAHDTEGCWSTGAATKEAAMLAYKVADTMLAARASAPSGASEGER